MNCATPILEILRFFGFFKQNHEIVIPSNSKAYYELKKAGINTDKVNKKDRIQNFFEKYFQEKIIILKKQDNKDKLQRRLRNVSLKNKIQLQSSKEKKRWTRKLEKAIINNRIEFYYGNNKSNYMTGVWNKFIYFSKPKSWYIKANNKILLKDIQKKLMLELKNSPIFVVENVFNEVITGESKNIFYQNFIERLEAKYNSIFFWQDQDELKEPCKIAFAFTNPRDASELKEYLKEQFNYSSYELNISIKIMSLAEFYKFSRTAPSMNQLKIIPDIKDLGNLLSKFRKKNNIKFHNKQVYGKDFFQGQPIYRLMPAKTNVKHGREYKKSVGDQDTLMLNYTPQHDIGFLNDITYYFTDLQNAEKAWANFYLNYNRVGIPKKPQIEVYNLESLLSDYENKIEGTPDKIRIIPTTEAKEFIEQEYSEEKNKKFSFENYKLLWKAKIKINRFLWGLTHRTAPSRYPAEWW